MSKLTAGMKKAYEIAPLEWEQFEFPRAWFTAATVFGDIWIQQEPNGKWLVIYPRRERRGDERKAKSLAHGKKMAEAWNRKKILPGLKLKT